MSFKVEVHSRNGTRIVGATVTARGQATGVTVIQNPQVDGEWLPLWGVTKGRDDRMKLPACFTLSADAITALDTAQADQTASGAHSGVIYVD